MVDSLLLRRERNEVLFALGLQPVAVVEANDDYEATYPIVPLTMPQQRQPPPGQGD
jgi:hypothetical protein